MNLLYQRLFRFESGERFPVLLWSEGPAFLPNVFLVAMRRPRGVASNTLKRDGRAIMHLYAWACSECVDIEARFEAGKFLSPTEVESLARACYLEYGCLTNALNAGKGKNPLLPMPGTSQVASETAAVRIDSIVGYLDWVATLTIHRLPDSSVEKRRLLEKARSDMQCALLARRPINQGRNTVGFREGLSESARALLLKVVSPMGMGTTGAMPSSTTKYEWSSKNPWQRHPVRVRNFLMILFLYQLGARAGELLAVKVGDINFTNNTILIRRSPDDPCDPRLHEPNTKTRDRILPMNDALAAILQRYLYEVRRQWVDPKGDHGYLWTSSQGSGAPLSMSGLKSMWATLRKRVPDLPEDIASHVLRHTWNDRFSEAKDQNRAKPTLIEQNQEEQERSYLMGWKPTSDTAKAYTRRHTREASRKASLKMQDELWNKDT